MRKVEKKRDRDELGEVKNSGVSSTTKKQKEDDRIAFLESLYKVLDVEDESHSKIPKSHQLDMHSHTKMVCTLDMEPSGARVVSGSADYMVKLWDFNGMDGSFQPFKSIEPKESHNVRWLRYNKKGGMILCAPGGNQAKVYNRELEEELEFMKGDVYLTQMKATKGHTGVITCCEWNPVNKEKLLTCGLDSTVRIWDLNVKHKHEQIIVGPRLPGRKLGYTVACFSPGFNFYYLFLFIICLFIYF